DFDAGRVIIRRVLAHDFHHHLGKIITRLAHDFEGKGGGGGICADAIGLC
ncbi:MAG: hypothetical protein HW384_674, partial [Dehalococcoidia bacterium]|nr:hypothetical protein [Dehalococcoidia bacterium]